MYNKKTLTFTFHHYWEAFCLGAFVLDPIGCVLRCPKDKLCYKSLQKGFFKKSVQAIRWDIHL